MAAVPRGAPPRLELMTAAASPPCRLAALDRECSLPGLAPTPCHEVEPWRLRLSFRRSLTYSAGDDRAVEPDGH